MHFDRSYIGSRLPAAAHFGRRVIIVSTAVWLAGCSTAIPLPSLVSSEDVTGSIRATVSPLSNELDSEDWRRARSALSVALDPQGNGAAVSWDNPKSGVKGSFLPVGDAKPAGEGICRAFTAELGGSVPVEHMEGVGCRDKSGEWAVGAVKPLKKA
jgi:surface antigen